MMAASKHGPDGRQYGRHGAKTATRETPMESGIGEVWVQRLLVALFVILAVVAWARFASGFLFWS